MEYQTPQRTRGNGSSQLLAKSVLPYDLSDGILCELGGWAIHYTVLRAKGHKILEHLFYLNIWGNLLI